MTRIVIRKIVLDDWNKEHIKKHKLSQREVIKAGESIIYHKKSYQGRYLVIGRSGSRLIAIVLKRLDLGMYYLITARDASKKERQRVYENEKK